MGALLEIIQTHVKYSRQLFKLAKSDLIKTYKGAAMGWLWAVIKPTITIGVYYFAFSILSFTAFKRMNDSLSCSSILPVKYFSVSSFSGITSFSRALTFLMVFLT